MTSKADRKAYMRTYYLENKEKIQKYQKEYRKKHTDEFKRYRYGYYRANKDKFRKYYQNHKKYYQNHKQERQEYQRQYRKGKRVRTTPYRPEVYKKRLSAMIMKFDINTGEVNCRNGNNH